jgi:hypothetical protein
MHWPRLVWARRMVYHRPPNEALQAPALTHLACSEPFMQPPQRPDHPAWEEPWFPGLAALLVPPEVLHHNMPLPLSDVVPYDDDEEPFQEYLTDSTAARDLLPCCRPAAFFDAVAARGVGAGASSAPVDFHHALWALLHDCRTSIELALPCRGVACCMRVRTVTCPKSECGGPCMQAACRIWQC